MLPDPLYTPESLTNTTIIVHSGQSFAQVLDDAGRTVRVGVVNSLPSKLTISRSETKENKPYGTLRVNIRLESEKSDATSGNKVTPAVQLSFILPKGVATVAELMSLKDKLAYLLVWGGQGSAYSSEQEVSNSTGTAFLTRILNGEG